MSSNTSAVDQPPECRTTRGRRSRRRSPPSESSSSSSSPLPPSESSSSSSSSSSPNPSLMTNQEILGKINKYEANKAKAMLKKQKLTLTDLEFLQSVVLEQPEQDLLRQADTEDDAKVLKHQLLAYYGHLSDFDVKTLSFYIHSSLEEDEKCNTLKPSCLTELSQSDKVFLARECIVHDLYDLAKVFVDPKDQSGVSLLKKAIAREDVVHSDLSRLNDSYDFPKSIYAFSVRPNHFHWKKSQKKLQHQPICIDDKVRLDCPGLLSATEKTKSSPEGCSEYKLEMIDSPEEVNTSFSPSKSTLRHKLVPSHQFACMNDVWEFLSRTNDECKVGIDLGFCTFSGVNTKRFEKLDLQSLPSNVHVELLVDSSSRIIEREAGVKRLGKASLWQLRMINGNIRSPFRYHQMFLEIEKQISKLDERIRQQITIRSPRFDEADVLFRRHSFESNRFDALICNDSDGLYCSPVFIDPVSLELFQLSDTERLGMKIAASWFGKSDFVLPQQSKRKFSRTQMNEWMETPSVSKRLLQDDGFRSSFKYLSGLYVKIDFLVPHEPNSGNWIQLKTPMFQKIKHAGQPINMFSYNPRTTIRTVFANSTAVFTKNDDGIIDWILPRVNSDINHRISMTTNDNIICQTLFDCTLSPSPDLDEGMRICCSKRVKEELTICITELGQPEPQFANCSCDFPDCWILDKPTDLVRLVFAHVEATLCVHPSPPRRTQEDGQSNRIVSIDPLVDKILETRVRDPTFRSGMSMALKQNKLDLGTKYKWLQTYTHRQNAYLKIDERVDRRRNHVWMSPNDVLPVRPFQLDVDSNRKLIGLGLMCSIIVYLLSLLYERDLGLNICLAFILVGVYGFLMKRLDTTLAQRNRDRWALALLAAASVVLLCNTALDDGLNLVLFTLCSMSFAWVLYRRNNMIARVLQPLQFVQDIAEITNGIQSLFWSAVFPHWQKEFMHAMATIDSQCDDEETRIVLKKSLFKKSRFQLNTPFLFSAFRKENDSWTTDHLDLFVWQNRLIQLKFNDVSVTIAKPANIPQKVHLPSGNSAWNTVSGLDSHIREQANKLIKGQFQSLANNWLLRRQLVQFKTSLEEKNQGRLISKTEFVTELSRKDAPVPFVWSKLNNLKIWKKLGSFAAESGNDLAHVSKAVIPKLTMKGSLKQDSWLDVFCTNDIEWPNEKRVTDQCPVSLTMIRGQFRYHRIAMQFPRLAKMLEVKNQKGKLLLPDLNKHLHSNITTIIDECPWVESCLRNISSERVPSLPLLAYSVYPMASSMREMDRCVWNGTLQVSAHGISACCLNVPKNLSKLFPPTSWQRMLLKRGTYHLDYMDQMKNPSQVKTWRLYLNDPGRYADNVSVLDFKKDFVKEGDLIVVGTLTRMATSTVWQSTKDAKRRSRSQKKRPGLRPGNARHSTSNRIVKDAQASKAQSLYLVGKKGFGGQVPTKSTADKVGHHIPVLMVNEFGTSRDCSRHDDKHSEEIPLGYARMQGSEGPLGKQRTCVSCRIPLVYARKQKVGLQHALFRATQHFYGHEVSFNRDTDSIKNFVRLFFHRIVEGKRPDNLTWKQK